MLGRCGVNSHPLAGISVYHGSSGHLVGLTVPSPRLPCRWPAHSPGTCLHLVADLTRYGCRAKEAKILLKSQNHKNRGQASPPDPQNQSWEGGDSRSLEFPNALENSSIQALPSYSCPESLSPNLHFLLRPSPHPQWQSLHPPTLRGFVRFCSRALRHPVLDVLIQFFPWATVNPLEHGNPCCFPCLGSTLMLNKKP